MSTEAPSYRLNTEPSAWLRGALADLVRRPAVRQTLAHTPPGVIIMTTLGRGERECDRCGYDTPEGDPRFYPFIKQPVRGLVVTVGLCAECIKHEVIA